ncbi:F0F1 ATP synthase subunit delta [Marinicella sp. S1101]|uniref:F0F1 ATP synthase subunit delta n=1 Tax=Marinicella marina TaxID=2996016 RepID=UPI002260EF02|nr:F0F1 ATP synthase subunit delta [Marinicella marina]MCX7554379.1 F0F1 ATP synthase subunit delta [Marinicella marina]MDJ1138630.1 F0F1 ATP synthase subunit delta [Marinicella marina]
MSEPITLARPYAKAAFEFAKSEAVVEQWAQNLMVAAGLAQNNQILDYFNQPEVLDEDLVQLVSGDDASEQYKNFVLLLAMNNRLSLLPEVAELYQYYLEKDAQSLSVDVYSAIELTDAQKQAMTAALNKRTGKQISLNTHIDESLMGGARIHCGDLVIDGTLRGKVERLKTQLFN